MIDTFFQNIFLPETRFSLAETQFLLLETRFSLPETQFSLPETRFSCKFGCILWNMITQNVKS